MAPSNDNKNNLFHFEETRHGKGIEIKGGGTWWEKWENRN